MARDYEKLRIQDISDSRKLANVISASLHNPGDG